MISLVVVDDDVEATEAVGDLCQATEDLRVVGSAANAEEGLSVISTADPDVALVDVRMPGLDGVELTRRLAGNGRDQRPKVVVLTAFAHDDYLVRGLAAGASAFLAKSTPFPELAEAIRAVHRGAAVIPPDLTRRLLDLVMAPANPPVGLTEREREILSLVGAGYANSDIASACFVSVSTVRTHLEHLRAKLGLRDRVSLALAARRLGLGYTDPE